MSTLAPIPFQVDQLVKVTSHYRWCGKDQHGKTGRVREIHDYRNPENPQPDEVFLEVQILAGHFRDGSPAWHGVPVPFYPHELAELYGAEGDYTDGGHARDREQWPQATEVPA